MTKLFLSMPDLHCSSCEKLVKASIGTKPGIQAVTVSLENKEVEISYNADEISSEAIIATLQEGTGYTVQEKIPETPIIETPINNYEVKNNEVQEQDLTSTNIYQIIQYSPERIVSKIIKTQGIAQVTLFAMSAGTEIYDHASTKNGIIYVLEGEWTCILDNNPLVMKTWQMIFMPKNTIHSLLAKENTSFLLTLTD